MNSSAKGRRNEHRGRDFFKEKGFKVVRSAGSFGIADLVCFGNGMILFINGKTNMWTPPGEREELARWVNELVTLPVFGVLMRFNDGDKEPKFQVYMCGRWMKITGDFFNVGTSVR